MAQRGFTQAHVAANAAQLLTGADALLGGATGTNPGTLTNGEECTFRVRANTYVDLAGGTDGTQDTGEDTLVGAWATGSATPLGAPGTPVGATVEPAHQSLVVSWSPARTADLKVNNGGSPITGYKIAWSSPTPVGSTTVSGTSHTITGLTNGLTYSVTIKAVNARGESAATTAETGVPRGVPTAPTNVQVSQPSAPAPGAPDLRGTQLIVAWSAPAANGTNPVTGYEVERRTSAIPGPGATCPTGVTANAVGGCPPGAWETSTGSNNGTRHVNTPIADADRGTSYDYRVRAVNGTDTLDKGPWSAFGSGTAADLPSAVDSTTVEQDRGASSVTLTWTPPDDSGSKITHYLVRYARNQTGNEPWSSMRRVEATPLPHYTISGLTGGTHEIGITAVNAIGSSDETLVDSQGADGSGLPAPSSVTVVPSAMTNTDGTRMDIAWSAVSNAKGYLVQIRDVADASRAWNDVSPAPTVTDPVAATDTGVAIAGTNYFKVRKHTITGLAAGTTYVVRVQAVTQGLSGGVPAGGAIVGSPGFSAAVKAEGTPSSAPTGLEVAQPAKTTTMRVTWTALSVADAATQRVTGYQVTWYPTLPQVPGARGSATVAADAASYDITNGTIGVGYTVVVQAVNHIGAGAPVTMTHTVVAAG